MTAYYEPFEGIQDTSEYPGKALRSHLYEKCEETTQAIEEMAQFLNMIEEEED